MWLTSDDSEFSKIFIESHKNTPFLMSASENFVIAWVNLPGASPYDVMSGRFEHLDGATPDARIE